MRISRRSTSAAFPFYIPKFAALAPAAPFSPCAEETTFPGTFPLFATTFEFAPVSPCAGALITLSGIMILASQDST